MESKQKVETKVTVKVDKEELKEENAEEEMKIEDLPGVGAATIEKLESAGYENVMSVAVATPGELVDASGVTETAARKMINAAREGLNMGFQSGTEYMKKREKIIKISTGSSNFNSILGGGIETGCISECFGAYGSSKTQVGHSLSVNCQVNDPTAVAVYIDTENTFRPDRVMQMAEAAGLNPQKALDNVRVGKAFNSDHQMLLAEKIEGMINDGVNVRMVIVDSLTAHFRAEFVGRGTLAVRQQKLNKHMHTLSRLADRFNIAVYVTNQVMSKPDVFFGDPTEAIGGHIVAHNSTFRIYLRRGKKGTRVAKLVDSPNLPDAEAIFMITDKGIEDA